MENLLIASTKRTPEVNFSTDGRLKISGRSIPEDPNQFYDKLFEWVFYYCQEATPTTTIDIALEYFNSGSSKAILEILRALVDTAKKGKQISINWYYEEGDDDILERGEYYESILDVKFNFIETE
jgi:hypothetical protein